MNKSQFLEKAKTSGKPVLVDFWAPWCAPCRKTKPVLEKLAEEYERDVSFWPLNVDEHQGLIQELKIYGIPSVLLLRQGEISARYTGAQGEDVYRQMFEALATGGSIQTSISSIDRIVRLGTGTITLLLALITTTWWLLPLGLLTLFTGIYDRCPIWKALTSYFKKLEKTP